MNLDVMASCECLIHFLYSISVPIPPPNTPYSQERRLRHPVSQFLVIHHPFDLFPDYLSAPYRNDKALSAVGKQVFSAGVGRGYYWHFASHRLRLNKRKPLFNGGQDENRCLGIHRPQVSP